MIFIKSFNRPVYLDRCLRAIHTFVSPGTGVTVMDDGTPQKYLDKIKLMYPGVKIALSPNCWTKRERRGEIPVAFWKEQVGNCRGDTFLLLEDDQWITGRVELAECVDACKHHRVSMVKLFWQGNPLFVDGRLVTLSDNVEEVIPREGASPYTRYMVAGAVFRKDYWLHLFEGAEERAYEQLQLGRAASYPDLKVAKYKREVVRTTYICSAVGDGSIPNKYMSELWYAGRLPPMKDFPDDFNLRDVVAIIDDEEVGTYLSWVAGFKRLYRAFGCEVE